MSYSKTLLRVVAAGVFALGSPTVAQDDDAALRAYYGANGLLNRGLYDLAADEYRAFLDAHPEHEKSLVARYGLGISLYRLHRYQDAAVELELLRKSEDAPYPAEVATVLGQSYLALGHHAEAAQSFGTVLARHGEHDLADDAAALQAEALYRAGRHDEVGKPVRLLVTRAPESPMRERAELFAGLADMALSRHARAADRFASMLERFPEGAHRAQVRLLLAQSRQRSGDDGAAEPEYRDVVARGDSAQLPEALYGLAALLQKRGDGNEAGTLLDRMLKNHPQHALTPSATLLRGRVHFDLEQYDDATRLLTPLAHPDGDPARHPEADDAAYWLAKCALRQGDPAAAATQFVELGRRFPDGPLADEAAYDLAVALVRANELEDASTALERFRTSWPGHPLAADAAHLEATVLHQLGRYDDSLARCQSFLRVHGESASARPIAFLRAENLYLTGADDEAALAYASFLDDNPAAPEHADALFRLGLVLHRLDKAEQATEVLERVVIGTAVPASHHAALLALGDLRFRAEEWPDAIALLGAYLDASDGEVDSLAGADDAVMKIALAHHRLQDFEAALVGYDRLSAEFADSPHHSQAMFERGQALVALERGDEAKVAFEALLAEGESRFSAHALNHLGAIALEAGRYEEAAARYAALASRGDAGELAVEALYQQGQAQFSNRQYADAAATLGSLLVMAPEFHDAGRASAERAISLARSGQTDAALAAIAEVESRYLHDVDVELRSAVLYDKAWCLRSLEDDAAAANAYRAILAEDEATALGPNAALELADLERSAGRLNESAALLAELVVNESHALHEAALYRLGSVAYEQGDFKSAATHLARYVSLYEKSDLVPSASLLTGESLYKRGAFEDSLPHLERAIATADPAQSESIHGPALLRLGECHAALQQWPQSASAFKTYLEQHPDSDLWFQARFGIGWALENQAKFDDAVVAYREVVDRHQGKTAARSQFQIGECLYAQKRFDEAVRALLKVDILYAYPQWSAAALHEAGRCFVELRDPAAARRHFRQVLEEHADSEWATLARRELERLDRAAIPGS